MAVMEALKEVTGTYGLVAIHQDQPDMMVGARRGSPLVLGIGTHEHFLASDVSAIVAHTQTVAHLRDFDVVTIDREGYRLKSLTHNKQGLEISQVDYSAGDADLGDFPHYMLKEIFEQTLSVQNTVRGRLNVEESTAQLGGLNLDPQELREVERILITGCGTAMHAGMVGEYIIESLAHLPVEIDFASEFRLRNSPLDRRTLVIAVSQSGETEDTLGALREARRKGHRVLGICNNVGSTLARETDGGVYMYAGPEVSVAATKSFTSQVAIFAAARPALRPHALSLRVAGPRDHPGHRGAARPDHRNPAAERPHPLHRGEISRRAARCSSSAARCTTASRWKAR